MKQNLIIKLLVVFLLCTTNSLHSYTQTKDNLFRDALRNATVERDFSSTAIIDRGDISEEEIVSWFQRNAPLSSKSKQIIVSYKSPKWKWGTERYTKTIISYVTQQHEKAFTEYYIEIARKEAEENSREEINKWVAIAGGTAIAIAFFSTDFGKQILLAGLSAFEDEKLSQSVTSNSNNSPNKERKEKEQKIEKKKQFDPGLTH